MKFALVAAGLLCLSTLSHGSSECNLYNFGLQGAFPCALEWWQATDHGQAYTTPPKMSDIIADSLILASWNRTWINDQLTGQINATSADPFAKIVETALVVEPYLAFAMSDLLESYDVTTDELATFELPAILASRSELIALYTNYFNYHCSQNVLDGFNTCINSWMSTNCVAEDKPEVITEVLNNFVNAWCDDADAFKSNLATSFTNDLGTVFGDLVKKFIVRVANSSYHFNLSSTAEQDVNTLGDVFQTECGFYFELFEDTGVLVLSDGTIGAGAAWENIQRLERAIVKCSLRAVDIVYPNFFENHEPLVKHFQLLASRYGLDGDDINYQPIWPGGPRHTVTCYGDPHIITYGTEESVTCPALGNQTYIDNAFFTLHGYASEPYPGTGASYVYEVTLGFHDKAEKDLVTYASGTGVLTNTLSGNLEGITISANGNGISIIDNRAGAVFQFEKWRETYFFSLRTSEGIFDNSFGIFVNGCPDPVNKDNAVPPQNPLRRRRSTICETACAEVAEKFRASCVFDCISTGETAVAEISQKVAVQEQAVSVMDEEIQAMFPNPNPTADPEDGGAGGSAASLAASSVIMIVSAFFLAV